MPCKLFNLLFLDQSQVPQFLEHGKKIAIRGEQHNVRLEAKRWEAVMVESNQKSNLHFWRKLEIRDFLLEGDRVYGAKLCSSFQKCGMCQQKESLL